MSEAPDLERCPICGQGTEDMRHVGVECFYAVDEVVPDIQKQPMFREVSETGNYLGYTRRYTGGTRDEWRTEQTGPNQARAWTEQLPLDPPDIRLLEQTLYVQSCCKRCRADFLGLLGAWAAGAHVTRDEPSEEACIPVRERGALRWLTRAEWDERQAQREG